MDQKSGSNLLQRNEQVKAISGLAANGGLALVAAALGRWFFEALDGNVMLWLLLGVGIIWAGVQVLTLLEAEA